MSSSSCRAVFRDQEEVLMPKALSKNSESQRKIQNFSSQNISFSLGKKIYNI
jgi:hypothetical protein